jgi:zona occludens toxin (predicted ATPase)
MAIMIIDGVPGAGKTYYAVKHLLDTYFSKNADGSYQPKKPVKIITNIDGFRLEHENLKEIVNASGGVKVFFSKDFQEKIFEKHGPVVYVIDEAQMIFDRKFYDREIFSWFEYHRHFGQNIYLITQSVSKLPKDVSSLVEYVIRALPRSRSITGKEFRYNHVSGRDILKRDIVLINKKIFEIYKSAGAEEVEKVSNPFLKIGVFIFVGAVLFFYFGWKYVFDSWDGGNDSEAFASVPNSHVSDVQIPKNQTLSPGSDRRHPGALPFQAENSQFLDDSASLLMPHKLNYLAVYSGKKSSIKILFNGRQYSLRTFPYSVEVEGSDLIAMIPQQDYYFYFPDGKPERKYYPLPSEPKKVSRVSERIERNRMNHDM